MFPLEKSPRRRQYDAWRDRMIFIGRAWKLNIAWIERQPVGDVNAMYHEAVKEIEERNKPEKNN